MGVLLTTWGKTWRCATRYGAGMALVVSLAVAGAVQIPAASGRTTLGPVDKAIDEESTANREVSATPQPVGPARGAPAARPPTGNPLWSIPLRSLSATRERPIFSPSRRPPPPPVVAAPYVAPVKAPPPAVVEPGQPLLALVGTIVGEGDSIGVFTDQATKKLVLLRTGQEHGGWILRSVEAREARFDRGDRTAILALPASGAPRVVEPEGGDAASAVVSGGDGWMSRASPMAAPTPRRPSQSAPLPPAATPVAGENWMSKAQ